MSFTIDKREKETGKERMEKKKAGLNRRIIIGIAVIIFLVVGIGPWAYYFMAGETHPWYPIKLSKWEPIEKVPGDFVPPEEVYIKKVPYFYIAYEQRFEKGIYYSGIPAAAMVANFYGDNLSLEEIAQEVPRAKWGITYDPSGLIGFFKKWGYVAKNYGGSERDLKYQLSKGRPVIVWQFRNPTYIIKKTNSIEQAGHSLHTRVVIGYKKINNQEYFIVHEGGMGTLDVTTGPAPTKPVFREGPMDPELAKKLELLIQEQEKLKSTLPDYVKVEDPNLINVMAGKDYFIKREDFLARWQNFILNPFGLPFTNSPTPPKPNFTILVYKE